MKEAIRVSVLMLVAMTLLTGVVYPLAVTVVAQAAFPAQANGSLIVRDGKPVGSRLIGQPFTRPGYFWGRPSATAPVPYNAASSGGSNLGPLNPALSDAVRERVEALRRADSSIDAVPADLVTASGSGLDPHISPEAAAIQAPRVAKERGIPETEVRELVTAHTEGRQWGLFGEPRVNVLELNLALDRSGETRRGDRVGGRVGRDDGEELARAEPRSGFELTRWGRMDPPGSRRSGPRPEPADDRRP